MAIPFDLTFIDKILSQAREYFFYHILSWAMVAQIGVIGLALLLAHKTTGAVRSWLGRIQAQCPEFQETYAEMPFLKVIDPLFAVIFLWVASRTAHHFHWPREVLYTALILVIALALVRLCTTQMHNRSWARILTIVLWLWAALYVFHLMDPWNHILAHIDFQLGSVQVSLLTLYRAFILVLVLYWLSRHLLMIWRFWLKTASGLTPAVRVLLYRLGSILLFSASVVFVLHYLGLDLTVFALFSGALGLGIGFGLQKVFANLISGFILLADKSIKPGDIIEVKDKYGRINHLGARYVSVLTRNGTEHLIPNENLVTGEVINWSHSQDLVRPTVPVGVAYGADLEKAKELMLEAAAVAPRVLKDPQPSCLLTGFGDNAVNLELQVWINDPQNGMENLKSDLLWGIWERFRANGIEFPFPQRDLHLKSIPEELRLQTKVEGG
jgi:small-conductance mechanosensitive channel